MALYLLSVLSLLSPASSPRVLESAARMSCLPCYPDSTRFDSTEVLLHFRDGIRIHRLLNSRLRLFCLCLRPLIIRHGVSAKSSFLPPTYSFDSSRQCHLSKNHPLSSGRTRFFHSTLSSAYIIHLTEVLLQRFTILSTLQTFISSSAVSFDSNLASDLAFRPIFCSDCRVDSTLCGTRRHD